MTAPAEDSIIFLMQMKCQRVVLILGVLTLGVLSATGCADGSGAAAATETPTEQPSEPTEAPTATVTLCDLALPGPESWQVAICEEFKDNAYGWQVESQENDKATYTSAVTLGEFTIDYFASGFGGYQKTALTWFDVASAENFALSVDGRIKSDSNTISWGIAFHADEEMGSFYLLSIYVDNSYAFEIYEDNAWISLISQRPFEGPPRGEPNRLGITATDGSFNFTINGNPLDEFNSAALNGQNIMLIVSAFEGARATFSFDNLVLQTK